MNLLHMIPIIQVENKIMLLQASLRKIDMDKKIYKYNESLINEMSREQEKIKMEIIKLNGKRNDFAAKLGELK